MHPGMGVHPQAQMMGMGMGMLEPTMMMKSPVSSSPFEGKGFYDGVHSAGAAYDLGLGFDGEESLLLSSGGGWGWVSGEWQQQVAVQQAIQRREVYEQQQAMMMGAGMGMGVGEKFDERDSYSRFTVHYLGGIKKHAGGIFSSRVQWGGGGVAEAKWACTENEVAEAKWHAQNGGGRGQMGMHRVGRQRPNGCAQSGEAEAKRVCTEYGGRNQMGMHRVGWQNWMRKCHHKKCSGLYTFSADLTWAPAAGFGTSRPILARMYGDFSRPECNMLTQLCTGQGSAIEQSSACNLKYFGRMRQG
ncbi:hypothetical protein B0H10DRAFT_1962502 [Mycena sp. CBHHK59/15]|nr:hypothetical protein B0H10DRAFT_1962502 [Mycena sp. CBHHK59/15]